MQGDLLGWHWPLHHWHPKRDLDGSSFKLRHVLQSPEDITGQLKTITKKGIKCTSTVIGRFIHLSVKQELTQRKLFCKTNERFHCCKYRHTVSIMEYIPQTKWYCSQQLLRAKLVNKCVFSAALCMVGIRQIWFSMLPPPTSICYQFTSCESRNKHEIRKETTIHWLTCKHNFCNILH
jgi:hypothetical protein